MEKTIHVCDGCGDTLESFRNTYNINTVVLAGHSYMDEAGGSDQNCIRLEFCGKCGKRLLAVLEQIATVPHEGKEG